MFPNLIIIGAPKCSTTSLHNYLDAHPDITMATLKELRFFMEAHNWSKGVVWYKSHFQQPTKILGETTPGYSRYPFHADVPQRMHALIPDAKLIYILRDPIDRIISYYVMRYGQNREDRSITDALNDFHENEYIDPSRYYMQLEQYLPYYSESQIMVVIAEELSQDPHQVLRQIYRFLDVDGSHVSSSISQVYNKHSLYRRQSPMGLFMARTRLAKVIERVPHYHIRTQLLWLYLYPFSHKVEKPLLDLNLLQHLQEYLRNDVDHLRRFTGKKLANWPV